MAKILIVDDDPDIVESMKVILEHKGYQVEYILSGDEALDKVKKIKPNLVILDVMMETKSKGLEVAREIKNDPDAKSVPIIMLTAIKEKMGLDFSKEAGDSVWLPVDDYSEKPLKTDDLLMKIERLLTNASQSSASQ